MTDVTGQALAELLDRSDERERLAGALELAAYHRGREDGYRAGYAQAVTDWKVTAGLLSGGPPFAELDRRRYPPGGRLSWIRLRPGERCAHEAASVPCPDDCKGREAA